MIDFFIPPVCRQISVAAAIAVAITYGCGAKHIKLYEALPGEPSEAGSPDATLFLIGDAGTVGCCSELVLKDLTREVQKAVSDSIGGVAVAYLGDNIYEKGLRNDVEHRQADIENLRRQIAVVAKAGLQVHGLFVAGNHDWGKGESDSQGLATLLRQRDYLTYSRDSIREANVRLAPDAGCAGPAVQRLGRSAKLVLIDTEWLIRKIDPEWVREAFGIACPYTSNAAFFGALSDTLQLGDASKGDASRHVVVLAHHPLITGGSHNGIIHWTWLLPPVFPYYLFIKSGGNVQDLASARYTAMRNGLYRAFPQVNPPLLYAAGHDHSLQVFRTAGLGRPTYQIVSGSGSKSTPVRYRDGMLYATDQHGYMRLDFYPDSVNLTVYALAGEVDAADATVTKVFWCRLTPVAPEEECREAPRPRTK